MKLKHRIGDFRVRELLAEDYLTASGPHRVYRVTKRKLTTPEAAAALAREAGVAPADVGIAGLKDRQGVTIQHMSVPVGDVVRIERPDLRVEPIGFAREPLTSAHSTGNAFEIRARGLSRADVATLRANLETLREHGVPNYFDDQRFGNLRHGQGWVAKLLFEGRLDDALRAIVATPPKPQGPWHGPEHGRAEYGGFERGLAERWGDWDACLELARKTGKHRSLFEHLAERPTDFAGAFHFVGQRVRLIHLFAWQSHLWNRAVTALLRERLPVEQRVVVDSIEGPLVCHAGALPDGLSFQTTFPLPADRLEQALAPDERELLEDALAEERLVADQMRVEEPPGFAMKAERRALFVRPGHLRVRPAEPDTEERGALSIKLAFELPRGAYATLVVKRLLAASVDQAERRHVAAPGARPTRDERTARRAGAGWQPSGGGRPFARRDTRDGGRGGGDARGTRRYGRPRPADERDVARGQEPYSSDVRGGEPRRYGRRPDEPRPERPFDDARGARRDDRDAREPRRYGRDPRDGERPSTRDDRQRPVGRDDRERSSARDDRDAAARYGKPRPIGRIGGWKPGAGAPGGFRPGAKPGGGLGGWRPGGAPGPGAGRGHGGARPWSRDDRGRDERGDRRGRPDTRDARAPRWADENDVPRDPQPRRYGRPPRDDAT